MATEQEIYNYLRNKPGVTHEHAMGMIANIKAESAFDSGVRGDFMIADPTGKLKNKEKLVNKKGGSYVYSENHPTKAGQKVEENLIADISPSAGGLFQHQGSRFKNMVDAVGEDWKTNWKGQIDFALQETDGKNYLKQDFTSVADSTKSFMINFERPANQSQEKIQSRINGVADLDLESNYTTAKEVTVDDIEAKYGPSARFTEINGQQKITYTDKDGVFQQIDRNTFFTNDTELTVDEKIQQNNNEEEEVELNNEEGAELNNEEQVNKDNESFKLGKGKFLKLGEKNYFVFENENGDVYSIPENVYLKEREKFGGGDIYNSVFSKKLPYTLQEIESKVNDGSFGYDKNYSINDLPKVETFDPNSIDLSTPNSNIPDFNREVVIPPISTEDKDLDNFLKSESDKDKKAKDAKEVEVNADETEGEKSNIKTEKEEEVTDETNDPVVGNIDGDADDLANDDLANTGGLPEMTVQKGLLDSIGGFGTVASALIGAKALKAANEPQAEIDMPELSDAFNAELYQQEQLSKRGFSPDQEAAARKQISDSYALGIENAVRGTAGDRAKLLAMSGVLDSQRQAALLDFAAKDDAAMQANKEQFNRTLMFKEKFDINNAQQMRNEKMQEINNRYSTNQQLAASAFKYAMDNVNNAKADAMQNQLTQVMINDASAGYDVKEKYSSGLLGKFASRVLPGLFGNNENNTETEQ